MSKRNFKSKLHLACANDPLRPALNHISFQDGKAVCTDSHILVAQDLHLHGFTLDERPHMEGKFLHRDTFKELLRAETIEATAEGFRCSLKGSEYVIKYTDVDFKFPNWQAVIPREKEALTEIGLAPTILAKLKELTLSENGNVVFDFHGNNRAVLIHGVGLTLEQETILIMPTLRH